ncbi:MAG: DUF3224 domain-containing protein [Thermomicrobiales bacterium]
MLVEGTYTILDWQQEAYGEPAPTLARASVSLEFRGGITGTGETMYLMTIRADGSADFVGQLRITGAIGEKTGRFVVHETGTFDGVESAQGEFRIIRGSGTGGMTGIAGSGAYLAAHGKDPVDFAGRIWEPTPERVAGYSFDIVFE